MSDYPHRFIDPDFPKDPDYYQVDEPGGMVYFHFDGDRQVSRSYLNENELIADGYILAGSNDD